MTKNLSGKAPNKSKWKFEVIGEQGQAENTAAEGEVWEELPAQVEQ